MKSFVRYGLFGFLAGIGISSAIPVIGDSCVNGCAQSTHWFKELPSGQEYCWIWTNEDGQGWDGRVRSDAGDETLIGCEDINTCSDIDCARWCDVVLSTWIESTGGSPHKGCGTIHGAALYECQI